ncbi:hypothetical protein TIFTF001_055708, partial [Ficus carica]
MFRIHCQGHVLRRGPRLGFCTEDGGELESGFGTGVGLLDRGRGRSLVWVQGMESGFRTGVEI